MASLSSSSIPATETALPGTADVEAAAGRLQGKAVHTPLLEVAALNERIGARVLIKPESLQRTGSFKFRGAYNRISQIPPEERNKGVVAYSSGNHAQGVAAAAALLGLPATIVMPADAPRIKIENTRGFGAEVVTYARDSEDRAAIAEEIVERKGATLVPPYDDPLVIAGQGTCGREIAQDAAARGAKIDHLLICCGGGGLTAGCALAFEALSPGTRVHSVEPVGFDSTARSLVSGKRETNRPGAASLCDALLAPQPGQTTLEINRRLLAEGLAVDDREIAAAMAYAFRTLKLVVEPGGAAALAALLSGKLEAPGDCVALVISGGNVDPAAYAEIIAGA